MTVGLVQTDGEEDRTLRAVLVGMTPVHIWCTAGNGSGPRQVCKVRIRHP
jgi:hypothetical protein